MAVAKKETKRSVMAELLQEQRKRQRAMRAAKPSGQKIDYTIMTWGEMAKVVDDLWKEMKRRNPIGINCYQGPLYGAYAAIEEIAKAEISNPTSECGPGVID